MALKTYKDLLPSDIGKIRSFMDSKWKNSESEASAHWLMSFALSRNNWNNFTKKEIDKFAGEDFWFNNLTNRGDIKEHFKLSAKLVDCAEYQPDERIGIATQKIKWSIKSHTFEFTDSFIEEMLRLANK